MALPILTTQQTADSVKPENKSCRIFVSYSHKDSDDARQFMDHFKLQLQGLPELFISPDQVFFDRNKLRAGKDWDESIQSALDQAEYFIFLVSVNSLNSEFCYLRELAFAVSRSLPIIQVILNPCPWEKLPIPGDRQKRNLGKLGALPKDIEFSLKPVSDWIGKDRAHVWNEVAKQITAEITAAISAQPTQPEQSQTIKAVTSAASQHKFVPLLPYFCNQTAAVNEFNKRVKLWSNTALLVLTKGIHDDDLPNFWKRLHHKNLSDYLTVRNAQLLETKRFIWPFNKEEKSNAQEMMATMMSALSDALTGNPYQLTDEATLSRWLSASSGVITLVTDLPKEPKKNTAAGIRVLLDLLEHCSAEAQLNRLVIAMMLEDSELITEKDLQKTLKISGYQRTHLVDIMPLRDIGKEDIIQWYRVHVEKLQRISEEDLLRNFANLLIQPLRMRKFASKINEIL
ncbi:toll/interleukin-1 receptor domain-containing protein [Nitrosomonas sp.]|uniref:toll/interleukin-1 receptor domain-containing protein n=1 Tax=Nitrosomonas sp. TaxID=42353 RepID=UPI001D58689D|nr:toll/interleukin-1 receptor domain-containing protein [Nitrosomonas sp.]MBX3617331.1 toll/interleukin-1 receptor domain-containing protein [Nitrosomonas sp.]